ncbi:MAG: aspartate kinase [Muribaculaceae bacterium]|nr:aspartate kinase [Muribaculaceae bacterium]
MKVLKFGGTSVGTVDSLRNVKSIVESIPGKAVIVVSALGGLTDKLLATSRLASKGDDQWKSEMEGIRRRHFDIIHEMVATDKKEDVAQQITHLLDSLEENYRNLNEIGQLDEAIENVIVSFGERMSSIIVAAIVENGKRYYSPDFIKTEKWYGKNIASSKKTEELIRAAFSQMGENEKAIVPGFISTDIETREITNLGRGGSDFTGALIAAALDAEVLEIWTDVDGFMTADPRIVKDALIIDHLTFTESMELCSFGAKVIYPPTIYPVFHKNIPIRILNTFNPTAPGTIVTDHQHHDDFDVKGVTALKDISLISVKVNKWPKDFDLLQSALNQLSRNGVTILQLPTEEAQSELYFGVNASEAEKALTIVKDHFDEFTIQEEVDTPIMTSGLAAVAVVGKNMRDRGRLCARIRHSLQREGIKVEAYSDKSATTFIYLISQGKVPEALTLIHSLLF